LTGQIENRRWVLARRPQGLVEQADFRLETAPVPEPAPGEFLVRVIYLSLAPVMAQYVTDGGVIEQQVGIGDVMRGRGVGIVVRSLHAGFQPGDVVHGPFGWQEYAVSDGKRLVYKSAQSVAPLSVSIGVLGITGYTAYFGMTDLASPAPGQALLVSGAVGGVGSSVGQIGRILGCSPIVAICGSAAKCALATGRLAYDVALDYNDPDFEARLDAALPGGVDVYFDNVGGRLLELALDRLRQKARVVLCGAISQYMTGAEPRGPSNYFKLAYANARMEGFQIYAFADRFTEAEATMAGWLADGRLTYLEDRLEGLERMPGALARLYERANVGKQVVQIAPDPQRPAPPGASDMKEPT
jgi:NADPH-dependent curcumin reductase CurA